MDATTTLVLAVIGGFAISAAYDAISKIPTGEPSLRPSKKKAVSRDQRPPSTWEAKCHPLEREVSESIHAYFLKGWKFRSEKVRAKFAGQGLATWHCYAFPEAKDDRIEAGALLSVILFLIDGMFRCSNPKGLLGTPWLTKQSQMILSTCPSRKAPPS